jgi:hypothetical protein
LSPIAGHGKFAAAVEELRGIWFGGKRRSTSADSRDRENFGERCPNVITNNIKEKADYVVVLDHECGKSIFSIEIRLSSLRVLQGIQ